MGNFKKFGTDLLSKWSGVVHKYPVYVLFFLLSLAAVSVLYTVNHLGMNTDTLDMLDEELPWRKADLHYKSEFPWYRDNIVIVVEATSPDQAQDAAAELHERLLLEQDRYTDIFYFRALDLFNDSALLFLDTEELQELADDLAAVQPFLATLAGDQSLHGLFSMLESAIQADYKGEDVNILPLVSEINTALEQSRVDPGWRMSWQLLMDPDAEIRTIYREFILLQPLLDYSSLAPAGEALQHIHDIREKSGIEDRFGVTLRLTGGVVLQQEELDSVIRGTQMAFTAALIMVTIIMMAGLRSIRLMLFTLVTLITGLLITAGFATLTVGTLNLISVAFTVLYIGLGVDFAIHFCLRYREHLLHKTDNNSAITGTTVNIGSSLFLCAVSTAVGFFAFIPTDYRGVAELGWIAGFGMLISFTVTLSMLPALLNLFPLQSIALSGNRPGLVRKLGALPGKFPGHILFMSMIILFISVMFLRDISFDPNTLNLQNPDNESVQTFRDLLTDKTVTPWTAVSVTGSRENAVRLAGELSKLDVVSKTLFINDFIPGDQDEKLAIVDQLGLLLEGLDDRDTPVAGDDGRNRVAATELLDMLQQTLLPAKRPEYSRLEKNLDTLLQQDNSRLRLAEISLLASLPGRLDSLVRSLNADYISIDNLPPALKKRWVSDSGHFRIEIYPQEDLQDTSALNEFVQQLHNVDDRITGTPIINYSASRSVSAAFRHAFLFAFAVITLILFLLCSKRTDVFYVLAPLLAAAVITAAVSVIVGIPLNFANVIALPLLLGIGVDSGIHIIHRYRTDSPADGNILHSSSARGVVVSSLTTMAGIGNLAISPHAGTASMGVLLTIGIIITLICMLVLLPALLAWNEKAGEN